MARRRGFVVSGADVVVGVATYERKDAIVRTLRTLAELDDIGGRLRRVVVVDNGSRDGGAHIGRFIEQHEGPLRFELVHEPTPGKTAALRRLFAETDEPYVLTTDDDCLLEQGWARAFAERLDAEARCGAMGGKMAPGWETGPTRLARVYQQSLGHQDLGDAAIELKDRHSFLGGASMAYRREAVEASGWLEAGLLDCRRDEAIEHGEDAELCLRIRNAGWSVWYEPGARLTHLVPTDRQSARSLATMRRSIKRSEPVLRWVTEGGRLDGEEVARQLRRARRLYLKSLLTDLRPTRRRIRVGERLGWLEGWRRVESLNRGAAEGVVAGSAASGEASARAS